MDNETEVVVRMRIHCQQSNTLVPVLQGLSLILLQLSLITIIARESVVVTHNSPSQCSLAVPRRDNHRDCTDIARVHRIKEREHITITTTIIIALF